MYRINGWLINEDTCTLCKGDLEVKISPRCMDVLVYLVEKQGSVVSAQELLEEFWPSASATDHAVHKVLTSLRRALQDEPANPTYIKTYPKRGYAFIADVSEHQEVDQAQAAPDDVAPAAVPWSRIIMPNWRLATLWAAAISAVLILGSYGYGEFVLENEAQELAILPILLSDDLGDADPYLQRGIENSLLASLTKLPNVKIFSAPDELHTQSGWNDYADEIGADNVLTLEFIAGREQLGVTIKLSDVESSEQLYVEQFYATRSNVIDVQTEIVANTVSALRLYLDEEQREAMQDWGTRSALAYDHFLKAEFYRQQHNHRHWNLAIESYKKAIDADPGFVNAYTGMATAANYKAVYSRGSTQAQLLELLDKYCLQLELIAPNDPAIDTLKSISLNIGSIDQEQLVNHYRDRILAGEAPNYVYAQLGLYLIGAKMYYEAAQFLDLATASGALVASPNQRANFQPAMLAPWNSEDILKAALYKHADHMGHLTLMIGNLAVQGRIEEARLFADRQSALDTAGIRSHLSQIILASVDGGLGAAYQDHLRLQRGERLLSASKYHHLFDEEQLADANLQFNNGLMALMLNSIESARKHWSNLNDIDRRRMFTTLYSLEMFLPQEVLVGEQYAQLLESLGAGRSWQRHLMEIVSETAEVTGVTLHSKTRSHYEANSYMRFNNLWSEEDWERLAQLKGKQNVAG